jgi:hypothetical protein
VVPVVGTQEVEMARKRSSRRPKSCKPTHHRGDPKGTKRYPKGCPKAGKFASKRSG